jgi:hypothetical protein
MLKVWNLILKQSSKPWLQTSFMLMVLAHQPLPAWYFLKVTCLAKHLAKDSIKVMTAIINQEMMEVSPTNSP